MKRLIAAGFLLLTLVSCSYPVQSAPTGTAIPTSTLVPLPTLTALVTQLPTLTPLPPSQTPDALSALVPEGQPAADWNGIPIMPGALAGEGDAESYVFTIKATSRQVQEYYELALGKLGWQPFVQGDGESSLMLTFMNSASETLTVSILAKDDEVLVLLVK